MRTDYCGSVRPPETLVSCSVHRALSEKCKGDSKKYARAKIAPLNFSNLMHKENRECCPRISPAAQSKDLRQVPEPINLRPVNAPSRQTTDLVGGGWSQNCHIVFINYNMIFVL